MTDEPQAPEAALPADSLLTDITPELDLSAGRPEGFPEEFWDTEKNTASIDKLFKSYTNEKTRAEGLRVKLSKGEFTGKPPEDINEYVVDLSDEMKPFIQDGDPLFETARQSAKEAGLSKDTFNKLMTPIINKIAEFKTQSEQPPSPEEIAQFRNDEIAKLGASGTRVVASVGAFIDQLQAGGTFSESQAATAKAMANSADAVRVLNKLRMMTGAQDAVPLELPVDGQASKSDIENKMAKAFADKNEDEFRKYSAMLSKFN